MFEIGKSFRFEAAHCLKHHKGKCSREHGHSYEFTLTVERTDLRLEGPSAGMVDDYDHITEVGKWIEDKLDHRHLNEIFDSDTTTAEELSRLIHDMARSRLPTLVEVVVKETAKTFSSYRPGRRLMRRAIEIADLATARLKTKLLRGIDTSDPAACWPYTGPKNEDGYGYLCSRSLAGTTTAHRVSAWLAGDDIEGKVVMHACDNRACVNPAHLYAGTHEENEADKDAKGRRPLGEERSTAKIAATDAIQIVERVVAGEPRRSIALSFGISTALVSAIMDGKVWAHITGKGRYAR